MQDFTQLQVWQKAHRLTVNVYKLTAEMPSEEKFGLISQIRRASVSIESNLAEGYIPIMQIRTSPHPPSPFSPRRRGAGTWPES